MTARPGNPADLTNSANVDAAKRQIHQIRLGDMPFSLRMWARLFASRYDQHIDQQVTVVAGTPLAAHSLRLASRREREDLAEALMLLLRDASRPSNVHTASARVPIRSDVVRQSADVVRDVLARLLGPLPVKTRGVARLRILLSDGRGPVYRTGSRSFAAAMRGVLAAL
jgi:hypothetical protein